MDKILLANYYEKIKRTLKKNKKSTYVETAVGKAKNFANRKEKAENLLQKARNSYEEAQKTVETLQGYTNAYRNVRFQNNITPENALSMFNANTTKRTLAEAKRMIDTAIMHSSEASKLLRNATSNAVSQKAKSLQQNIDGLKSLYESILESIRGIQQRAKEKQTELEEIERNLATKLKPYTPTNEELYESALENLGARELEEEELRVIASPPPPPSPVSPRPRRVSNGIIVPQLVRNIESRLKKINTQKKR